MREGRVVREGATRRGGCEAGGPLRHGWRRCEAGRGNKEAGGGVVRRAGALRGGRAVRGGGGGGCKAGWPLPGFRGRRATEALRGGRGHKDTDEARCSAEERGRGEGGVRNSKP